MYLNSTSLSLKLTSLFWVQVRDESPFQDQDCDNVLAGKASGAPKD
jgi:hypothetical protein